jgi:alkaline phosphatase
MLFTAGGLALSLGLAGRATADHLAALQAEAIETGRSAAAHWGTDPAKYTGWSSHSNRLIPVYTFGTRGGGDGIDLSSYTGANSVYRNEAAVRQIYGYLPEQTVSSGADYLDQTDVYRLQEAALHAGRKHVILVVFDGMDWDTTRAAAIHNLGRVGYQEGRGTGTHFQDYTAGGTTQFGWMVTSPHNDGTKVDVDQQSVENPGGKLRGGYDPARGGATPWAASADLEYLISRPEDASHRHAYTDSASSATSMTAGIKTYNDAINVDPAGNPVAPIAHEAQDRGYAIGVVTSVPISHATPASAYSQNVYRDDYQDLTRDLVGLNSISHSHEPLPGVDVLIGTGWGVERAKDSAQGANFVPGNAYLTSHDHEQIDLDRGGRYVVAMRTAGESGADILHRAAARAADGGHRLFGMFGVGGSRSTVNGNLPLATADGDFRLAPGKKGGASFQYTDADLRENPTLAEMTAAALTVLEKHPRGFWLMVEPGDVDWANHDNNLDASIGAVNSGDAAVKVITDWVEQHSNWNETVLIVTADHGHLLVIDRPELLARPESGGR